MDVAASRANITSHSAADLLTPLPMLRRNYDEYYKLVAGLVADLGLSGEELEFIMRIVERVAPKLHRWTIPTAFISSCCIVYRMSTDDDVTTKKAHEQMRHLPFLISSAALGRFQLQLMEMLDYKLISSGTD